MALTERQKNILKALITTYIEKAEPVSSQFLEKSFDFDVCSATIRNEMLDLTKKGYLYQPHTSAGRVPTSKAYRFFVEELMDLKDIELTERELRGFLEKIRERIFDKGGAETEMLRFFQDLDRTLSKITSSLAFSYFLECNFAIKEGWEELMKEPEFEEREMIDEFIALVNRLEKRLKEVVSKEKELEESGYKIYIGKENPFLKTDNFTIIVGKIDLPLKYERERSVFGILGPKRMDYQRGLGSVLSVLKIFNQR